VTTASLADDAVPRLPRGVRLSYDEARKRWLLLAPERLYELNDVALAVLKLVDGQRSLAAIAGELARTYNADAAVILADAKELVHGLAQKRLIEA
jgi:coenzyme PQQ biosynthesis protein PqqD